MEGRDGGGGGGVGSTGGRVRAVRVGAGEEVEDGQPKVRTPFRRNPTPAEKKALASLSPASVTDTTLAGEPITVGPLHPAAASTERSRREADNRVRHLEAAHQPSRRTRILPVQRRHQLQEQCHVGALRT